MSWIDRLILVLLLLVACACVLRLVVSPLVTIAVVGTVCFVVIAVTRHLTSRW